MHTINQIEGKINKKLQNDCKKMKNKSLHSMNYYLNKSQRKNFTKRKFLKIAKPRFIKFSKQYYVK